MTMGTRLACMAAGSLSEPRGIVPGLLFMGNALCGGCRHDSCTFDECRDHLISHEFRAQGGACLGSLVERPHLLDDATLPHGHRFDLGCELLVLDRNAVTFRNRIEEKLGTHLPL